MARKTFGAVAFCVAVLLALTFGELPGAAAIQRVKKSQRKTARLRKPISYVCPMHPDIRSKSRGTCPKCLMDLVAEGRDAKRTRH